MKALILAQTTITMIAVLWASATPVLACTCAPGSPLDSLDQSRSVVVVGSVTDLFVGSGGVYPSGSVFARFEAEEYLRGEGPEKFNLDAYGLVVNDAGGLSNHG